MYEHFIEIVEGEDLPSTLKAIYCGTTGTLTVLDKNDVEFAFKVVAGTTLEIAPKQVKAGGVADIVGLG